jgi:hypothetical protein
MDQSPNPDLKHTLFDSVCGTMATGGLLNQDE